MRTKVFDRIKALLNWIKNHKYIFVTIVFLAIIIVVDDNNMISHIKNKATIDKLTDEIREMEADSAEVQAHVVYSATLMANASCSQSSVTVLPWPLF